MTLPRILPRAGSTTRPNKRSPLDPALRALVRPLVACSATVRGTALDSEGLLGQRKRGGGAAERHMHNEPTRYEGPANPPRAAPETAHAAGQRFARELGDLSGVDLGVFQVIEAHLLRENASGSVDAACKALEELARTRAKGPAQP